MFWPKALDLDVHVVALDARGIRRDAALEALNHTNIAAIYGFEESGAVKALVLELVEGQTLAELLASGSKLRALGEALQR